MKNWKNFDAFRSYIFDKSRKNREVHFECEIHYKSNYQNVICNGECILHTGANSLGDISIEENNSLSSDNFHLSFKREYQKFSFNEKTKSVTITDEDSKKMGGKYTVYLIPFPHDSQPQ